MKDYRAEMRKRAAALADNLDPRLNAHAPEGAFYCFINLAAQAPDPAAAEAAAVERLMQAGIAVVPGSAFGADFTGYARLSFSTLPAKQIEEGARRFNAVALGER
jgi:aspartate aminotransferase